MKPSLRRALSLFAATCFPLAAFAQPPADPASATKQLAFEVVALHPSPPGTDTFVSDRITPDGYRTIGQPLSATILMAYFPQGQAYWNDRLQGRPPWLREHYDIDAKVSEADRAAWQKQGASLAEKPMFRAMLRTMLAERCHLVAHMVPAPPIDGWSIELSKSGPRVTPTKPDETFPTGRKFFDGVWVEDRQGKELHQRLYNVTMDQLAAFLSNRAGPHPVQDHTGLTGHYDVVLNWVDDPDSKLYPGGTDWDDPDAVLHWDVKSLGLRLVPIKVPIDNLVIDHIEKPSEN